MRSFPFGHTKSLFAAMCSATALTILITVPGLVRADSVAIDETNFPDKTIREYVIKFDKDEDGSLSEDEILAANTIVISDVELTSTKGLELFTEVDYLSLCGCKIDSLDLSPYKKLVTLYCAGNKLTKLDLGSNPALGHLDCSNNKITSLDLSKNPEVCDISCNYNMLTKLDVSNLPDLNSLSCRNNSIKELDLTHSPKLGTLYCSENKLQELDLQFNTELSLFECDNNDLTSLDLTKCTKMAMADCSNNKITDLRVSNLQALGSLYASNNNLSSLDLTGDKKLDTLNLSYNKFEEIDLRPSRKLSVVYLSHNKLKKFVPSQSPGLCSLYIDNNNISSLNVSKNNNLYTLSCSNNNLSKIDISSLPRIQSLICSDNKIKTIDISKNQTLDSLFCGNNLLTKIDLSKNPDLYELSCFGNDISKLDISKNDNLKRAMEKGEFYVGTNKKGEPFYSYYDEEFHYVDGEDWYEYFTLVFDASTEVVNGSKTRITLNKSIANLICGKSMQIKATLTGSKTNIVWKSSDEKIATVDSKGNVKAKMAGRVNITASSNGYRVGCEITVLYKDVTNPKDFWYNPTNTLTSWGVVKGYDKQTKFKPANDCTRAQMLTFIWRLAGSPDPVSETCSFPDVKKSDYFFKPVIWAVEKEITTGYNDGTFKPQNVCTRAQTVTFLWRLAGKPAPKSSKCSFKDVKKTNYFYEPVIWAYENKIVAGYKDGTFKPQGKCLRRQMVTFLYKAANNPNGLIRQ